MKSNIKIITRKSQLAIAQAQIIDNLIKQNSSYFTEICKVTSDGDNTELKLGDFNAKNLFTKYLDNQVILKKADLSVHSMKDLAIFSKDSPLALSGLIKREDPSDLLFAKNAKNLYGIKKGSTYLTSSLRRKAQILNFDKKAKVLPIRGNIISRLLQFEKDQKADAIILAKAGIIRLIASFEAKTINEILARFEKNSILSSDLSLNDFLPAANQGQIGCCFLTNNEKISRLLAKLSDDQSSQTCLAERKFLKLISATCHMPLACYANLINDEIRFRVVYYNQEFKIAFEFDKTSPLVQKDALIEEAAEQYLAKING